MSDKKTKAEQAEETKAEETKAEETKAEETKAEETKAVPVVKAYDPDELVPYTAPLLPGTKQKDLWVAVNGETCVIKRGIPVEIKRKFLEAIQNADRQKLAAYQEMAKIQKQGEKPAAEM